ncbi:hypothetical protein ACF1G5_26445 [Streptomyces coeruleorubidus]|uniref:hypothetical protein n=1 Tax=Streptomyces coeruleorubidus TaxID=116188 RepID=UPI0036F5E9D1
MIPCGGRASRHSGSPGPAYRDDPRCAEAEQRIGPVDAEPPSGERLMDVRRYQRRQETGGGS